MVSVRCVANSNMECTNKSTKQKTNRIKLLENKTRAPTTHSGVKEGINSKRIPTKVNE